MRTRTYGAIVVASGAALVIGAATLTPTFAFQTNNRQDTPRESPITAAQLEHAQSLSQAFRNVSRTVNPSVVSIQPVQRADAQANRQMPQPRTPLEEEFFRRFFGDNPELQIPDSPRERIGQGSGVIIRQDGFIITNNHVVDGATEIRVKVVGDPNEYTATVTGTDPESDLAVIKIDASGLTPASLGNSDQMEVGDWVLAIGSPFGFDHTVTAGIVSGKGRQVGIIRDPRGFTGFEDFIQTDAAINPGNSGGPLVNLQGQVIGINTAISTRTGTNIGVGFAIPSNMVRPVMESLIETGTVRRGALGVGIQPLTREHASYHGYQSTEGAVISQVYPGSAAERAGIRAGDIIVRINGQPVIDTQSVMSTVGQRAPGEEVEIEIYRNGRRSTREVKLGDRAAQFASSGASRGGSGGTDESAAPSSSGGLGLTVQDLTPELAGQLDAEGRTGVVVSRIAPDGLAARAGIARGDIIARVDETDVTSLREFNQAIDNADLARGVALQIFRGGAARVVIVRQAER